MSAIEYRVHLEIFDGPLDLLVYLVRRHEIDPVEIRVARITEQFLEFLEVLKYLDLDMIGDFVVMAGTLIEIKSRLVLPTQESDDEVIETADDSHSDLIRQLLEYKQYKEAAKGLEERAARWQDRYPRLSDDRPQFGKDPAADRIREVELWDLVSALSRIMTRHVVEEEASIRCDDTPIAVYVERIRQRVLHSGRSAFSEFFDGERVRSRIVGIFLAILELIRHHGFRAQQPVEYGDIWIHPPTTARASARTDRETTAAEDLTPPGPSDAPGPV